MTARPHDNKTRITIAFLFLVLMFEQAQISTKKKLCKCKVFIVGMIGLPPSSR